MEDTFFLGRFCQKQVYQIEGVIPFLIPNSGKVRLCALCAFCVLSVSSSLRLLLPAQARENLA
jgi:hypothetical protein